MHSYRHLGGTGTCGTMIVSWAAAVGDGCAYQHMARSRMHVDHGSDSTAFRYFVDQFILIVGFPLNICWRCDRQELTRVWRGGREKCVEWVLKIRSFGGEMNLKYLMYCTVPCTVADAVVLAHDYMTGTIEDATFTTIIAFFEDCQMHHECLQGSEIFN